MKNRELKNALRAAARLSGESEFLIIGSQAVHAHCARPPAEVLLSQECDLYPRTYPETGPLLDRELGRNSKFARQHGYYIDVVTPDIASLPDGWEQRLKAFRVGRITGLCLDIHDLLASKLAAGRLKDLELAGALLKLRLARVPTLRARVAKMLPNTASEHASSLLELVLKDLKRKRTPK